MMRSTLDLAWLGGLLEGEGSFMLRNGSPVIALQTTDRDVLHRAASLMDTKEQGGGRRPKGKDPNIVLRGPTVLCGGRE